MHTFCSGFLEFHSFMFSTLKITRPCSHFTRVTYCVFIVEHSGKLAICTEAEQEFDLFKCLWNFPLSLGNLKCLRWINSLAV
jgi:hypothetical protein